MSQNPTIRFRIERKNREFDLQSLYNQLKRTGKVVEPLFNTTLSLNQTKRIEKLAKDHNLQVYDEPPPPTNTSTAPPPPSVHEAIASMGGVVPQLPQRKQHAPPPVRYARYDTPRPVYKPSKVNPTTEPNLDDFAMLDDFSYSDEEVEEYKGDYGDGNDNDSNDNGNANDNDGNDFLMYDESDPTIPFYRTHYINRDPNLTQQQKIDYWETQWTPPSATYVKDINAALDDLQASGVIRAIEALNLPPVEPDPILDAQLKAMYSCIFTNKSSNQ
jgi:hypothetical protein